MKDQVVENVEKQAAPKKGKTSRSASKHTGRRVVVRQVRSAIGRTRRTKDTLESLGLGRIGDQQVLPHNPAIMGALCRVSHLVDVNEVN